MALLSGKKTQTRRIVKPQPEETIHGFLWKGWVYPDLENMAATAHCPYGQPGDRLWVRETWKYLDWTDDGEPYIAYAADGRNMLKHPSEEWSEKVQDIWAELSAYENYKIERRASDKRWRPSIHMPRWASRITLEITGIRVERLQEISEVDARAEGALYEDCWPTYRQAFEGLWCKINGSKSWDANPWVWVIEFKQTASTEG